MWFSFFKKDYEDLSPEAFKQQLEEHPDAVLLDVRTPEEYARDHISGAKLMNCYDSDFESRLDKMDREKTYLVYCHSGGRSSSVCNLMKEKGFKTVYNLRGGIVAWRRVFPKD